MLRAAVIAAGLAGSLTLAAGVRAPAQAETVLRIKNTGDIKQLDALFTSSYPTRDMAYLIYDTLFSLDGNYQVQPQMVEDYTRSQDGRTYTFKLRDGLKFHDGKPVTSGDCIASIERWMKKDSLGAELEKRLEAIKPVDAATFEVRLKEPFARILDGFGRMTAYPLFIMPERLAKTPATTELKEFVGSGPFKLMPEEWIPGVKFVLAKNPDYKPRSEPPSGLAGGKIAGVDRIERIQFSDDLSAVNALLAGEIDYVAELPPEMLPVLEKDKAIKVEKAPVLGKNLQVVINHTQPPMDNVRIRQALQYAISQSDSMQALFGSRKDLYQLCPALFMCGSPYETAVGSERFMKQDFEKARALLKEAGYDGTPIVYLHPMDLKAQRDVGTVMVSSMRKAGFVVEDVQMDTATMFTRRASKASPRQGGWNVFITGFAGDALMDPLTNPYVTGACEKAFIGWPCDKPLQDLWQAFLTAGDEAARKTAAIAMQARANEIVTYIPLGQYNDLSAWRKTVSGFVPGATLTYWNARKSD
ncbi:ABC transporter substrate-binding protein [Bosea psychrotolerans]|uniref:Peptide/nickel transport system substrate-binding protein n=1 Tax=Bosea psychrotolerans TaxID=1871628 RepID=A0A2S4LWX0_9HYPH|nr:ABC transporter substrate-binding protein [Bosea psychrotolerans]POR46954.1 peptide/nickel transport system substrate-binding protein [Bosea psychrotolerans]